MHNMENKAVITPLLPDPLSAFHPHARITGDFIYVSGLISRNLEGLHGVTLSPEGCVVSYDIEIQTRVIFENLEKILKEAGSSLAHVIDVSVFLTSIEKDFKSFNKVYGEIMGDICPCRTTVEVSRFPSPVQIEIKCIALRS